MNSKYGMYVLGILSASLCQPPASAAFVSIAVEDVTANDDGLAEYAVYAMFDNPNDWLNGIAQANIFSSTGFYHSSVNGQKSALPWTTAQNALSDNPDVDSFVTIALSYGDFNQTNLVNFDLDAFFNGTSLGEDVLWYSPAAPIQGLAGEDLKVLIGVFAPLNDNSGNAGVVSGTLYVSYFNSTTGKADVAFTSFTTVPAPAALSLFLAATAFAQGRRRR